jgi:Cu-Zn family superoxide dismutase
MFAYALLNGGSLAPNLKGNVYFIDIQGGVQVCVSVTGLPEYKPGENGNLPIGPHGFHIHENGTCEVGDPNDPFKSAGGHWNPTNQPHGNHAGDFPTLFSNNGVSMMCFFTNKFRVQDVIGKAVIIHQSPDDNKSQPAGNAGKRLACGVITQGTIPPTQQNRMYYYYY